ncbi:MAG: transposase [Terrimicrobiaceae bacterium]
MALRVIRVRGERWSARGSRPKVIGAVRPGPEECCTMIFDGVDTDVFQYYLDFLAEQIPKESSKRRLFIVDNASWHRAKSLAWHHFELQFLPAYSPDFIPSKGSGYASRPTSLATSSRGAPTNSPSGFATRRPL